MLASVLVVLFSLEMSAVSSPGYATESCRVWRENKPEEEVGVRRISTSVICFSGEINAESAAALMAELPRGEGDPSTTLVVNSRGGEVEAGMSIGEAISELPTTVIVDGLCASSCANYLFMAGDRRIIEKESALIFHGGVVPVEEDKLREELRPMVPSGELDAVVQGMKAQMVQSLARQSRLLDGWEIDADFFSWMAGLFSRPTVGSCDMSEADAVVFSDSVLLEHGVRIHENHGVKNQRDAERVLTSNGLSRKICFIEST